MEIRIIHMINDKTSEEMLSFTDKEDETPAVDFCPPGFHVESDTVFQCDEYLGTFPKGHDFRKAF